MNDSNSIDPAPSYCCRFERTARDRLPNRSAHAGAVRYAGPGLVLRDEFG